MCPPPPPSGHSHHTVVMSSISPLFSVSASHWWTWGLRPDSKPNGASASSKHTWTGLNQGHEIIFLIIEEIPDLFMFKAHFVKTGWVTFALSLFQVLRGAVRKGCQSVWYGMRPLPSLMRCLCWKSESSPCSIGSVSTL